MYFCRFDVHKKFGDVILSSLEEQKFLPTQNIFDYKVDGVEQEIETREVYTIIVGDCEEHIYNIIELRKINDYKSLFLIEKQKE